MVGRSEAMTLREQMVAIFYKHGLLAVQKGAIDEILALSSLVELDPNQDDPRNPWWGVPAHFAVYKAAQQAMREDNFRRVKPKEGDNANMVP